MTDTLTAPAGPATVRPGRSRRWPWGAVPAVLVPAVLVAWHASYYGRWEVDDAGITFAYARSVATGAGPVLQPGLPPVEGFSDPAWLALLVVGRWLGLFDNGTWFGVPDYVAYPKALAILLVAGMFACFYATASAVCRRPAVVTIAAGAICAAIPSFVIWCVSGLENSLFVLVAVGLATVLVRSEARGRLVAAGPAAACGLLAAVAALTRPEGMIYAAAYPLAVLVLIRRGGWLRGAIAVVIAVLAFAVPLGSYLLWRHATFGAWLPTTAVAKSQGLPTAASFAKVSDLVAYAGWLAVLVAVLLVGAAAGRASFARHAVVLLMIPLGLALVAFGVLVNDWMIQYRFATPVWALGALVVAISADEVLGRLRPRARVVVAVVAVAAVALSGTQWVKAARSYRAEPVAPMCLIVQNTGREFNGYVGILGLTSPDAVRAGDRRRGARRDVPAHRRRRARRADDREALGREELGGRARLRVRRGEAVVHPLARPVPHADGVRRRPPFRRGIRPHRAHPQRRRQLGTPRPRPGPRHDGAAAGLGRSGRRRRRGAAGHAAGVLR